MEPHPLGKHPLPPPMRTSIPPSGLGFPPNPSVLCIFSKTLNLFRSPHPRHAPPPSPPAANEAGGSPEALSLLLGAPPLLLHPQLPPVPPAPGPPFCSRSGFWLLPAGRPDIRIQSLLLPAPIPHVLLKPFPEGFAALLVWHFLDSLGGLDPLL